MFKTVVCVLWIYRGMHLIFGSSKFVFMSTWFTAKIRYVKQKPEDGSVFTKTESYMLNSMSFTEAEARLLGILEEYIGDYELLTCAKTRIQDVVIDEAQEFFYKVKVNYISTDPDSGKEKKIAENYVVQANGLKEAYEKMEVRMAGSIVDWEIPSITKTNIIDVFPYVEETVMEKKEAVEEEVE